MPQNSYTFHVKGMHCRSCVLLIESEISALPNIVRAKSDLNDATLFVEGNFQGKTPEAVAQELTGIIASHGYEITTEKPARDKDMGEFALAIPFALGFLALFFLLQKAGVVNMVDAAEMSYRTVFLIGVVASLSTCMAVVGGLALSLSAEYAKSEKKFTPPVLFHIGRLLSFFILGGALGMTGSVFQMNANVSSVLGIIVAFVMLLLGIDLLGVFNFHKKFQPSMPKAVSRRALGVSKWKGMVAPFFIGVSTFFLPCGFTQSMQIYALSTGNFWSGAWTMLVFALGTLPALAMISFGAWSIGKSGKAGIFFKTAGLIVILFAVFNLVNGLAAMGIIRPIFHF